MYVDGMRLVIWLKERIKIWREATTVNDVNILKIVTPSLLVGRFCACSKAVLRNFPVTDSESME